MESLIAKAIQLQYQPVALLRSNEKPQGAMQFSESKWGCVMWLAAAAARGKSAVADAKLLAVLAAALALVSATSIKISLAEKKAFAIFFPPATLQGKVARSLPRRLNLT